MSKDSKTQNYVGSLEESKIRFDFKRDFIKFDGEIFYKTYCSEWKGVDFLVVDEKKLVFVEVKNFRGDERDNVWKLFPDNAKKQKARKAQGFSDSKNSLDIEVAAKVRDSWTAFCGARTFNEECDKQISQEFRALLQSSNKALEPTSTVNSRIVVVLFLEGAVPKNGSQEFKKIAQLIRDSLDAKLKWLNCLVYVVDLNEASKRNAISRLFDATLLPNA